MIGSKSRPVIAQVECGATCAGLLVDTVWSATWDELKKARQRREKKIEMTLFFEPQHFVTVNWIW